MEGGGAEGQQELLALREAYLSKPMLVGGIIDEDADFGAIIVEMDRSSTDPPEEILAPEEVEDSLEWVLKVILEVFVTYALYVTTNTKVAVVHDVAPKCNVQISK